MAINRRSFLAALAAGVAALALDPEKAPWVPGQKTIFLPAQTIYDPAPAGNYCLTID